MADKKYYVIQNGDNRGIYYETWADFQPKVKGVSGVIYKGFTDEESASVFLGQNGYESSSEVISRDDPFGKVSADGITAEIYVDGSYNKVKNAYGYGVFIMCGNRTKILSGMGQCEEDGRNIEGEVAGAKAAIDYIKNHTDIKDMVIFHDYEGIGKWPRRDDGTIIWQATKGYTQAYREFVDQARMAGLNVRFEHVKGHTGYLGNEYVDRIAKIACGINVTKKDTELLEELRSVDGFPVIDDVSRFEDAKVESDLLYK